METNKEKYFSDATKDLMRSSGGWMRGYAIMMIVFLSLLILGLIMLSSSPKGKIINTFASAAPAEAKAAMADMLNFVILGGAIFIVLLGYGVVKLLAAGNNFTSISYTEKKTDIVSVFKNMKLYWMYYSISMIALIVMAIYFVVRMVTLAG